jgi:hypothetical protein
MPLEVHPLMQDSDDDGPALGSPRKHNVRADRELSIAGTAIVAGISTARVFRNGFGGALKFAQICLRLFESEPLDRIIPDLSDVALGLRRELDTPQDARGAVFRLSSRKASKLNGEGAPLCSPSISAA